MLTHPGSTATTETISALQSDAGALLIALLVVIVSMFRTAPMAYAQFTTTPSPLEYRFTTLYQDPKPTGTMVIYLPRAVWDDPGTAITLHPR